MATKIYTVTDLQNIENDLDGDYELANDIDASATSGWNGGAGFVPLSYFEGTFDGKDYTISNLFINRPTTWGVGLFGYSVGTISNVHLTSADITGETQVGILVGCCYGAIENCSSTGEITAESEVGGLIGRLSGSSASIKDSYSTAIVLCTVGQGAGGLVGWMMNSAEIDSCYANCSVTGEWWGTGGLVGRADYGSNIINNCYALGTVTNTDDEGLGGLVGSATSSAITNCYSAALVVGVGTDTGGLLGYSTATVTDSFWDTQTSGQVTSAGGTGKTTVQMKDIVTFSPWEIQRTETDLNNGYPFLGWQDDNGIAWLITGSLAPRETIEVEDKITLEAIRNIEMSSGGKFHIDEEGKAVYNSRFTR